MNPSTASLSLALLAALAASDARAVHVDPNGLGQVLIYPYYTVNAGHATLFSVVNTTSWTKAVKVRWREGVKGRAVLDFNLYLAPFDVYSAALVSGADDASAQLLSTDMTCTVPAPQNANPVLTRDMHYAGPDDGPPGVTRGREGWIELIEMGVVEDTNVSSSDVDTSFADAAQPRAGRPVGCDRLVAAWDGGVWSRNATQAATGAAVGVSPPRGGLYGGAVILDVAEGVAFQYAADAIDGFFGLEQTLLHTAPGAIAPDLASAQTRPGHAEAHIYAGGREGSRDFVATHAVELDFVAGRPDAVSAVLMAEGFFNEFNITPALAAQSEWVVTFPTRYLHEQSSDLARRRPFVTTNLGCEELFLTYFDRETGPEAPAPIVDQTFEPRRPGFCYHTQVIPWGTALRDTESSRLLGSQLLAETGEVNQLNMLLMAGGSQVAQGHVIMGFSGYAFLLDGAENVGQAPRYQLFGLPLTGFWASNVVNSAARPGLLANYSTATRHRARLWGRSVRVSAEGTPGEIITPLEGR